MPITKMLALLALASAAYEGPKGYCTPFTARYLTLIDDVLVFHGGQGYILRPKRGCQAEMSLPKHEDRHAVSYLKPFRAATWLNDTLSSSRSLGLPPAMVNNYAVAKTPWGFAAIGGGELDVTSPRIRSLVGSRIMHMTKPTWDAPWSKPHPIIGTGHPGCVDVRLSVHRCEYDGKLSLTTVNASHFRVYARANREKHGGRHVVTALCANRRGGEVAPHHACGPFSLIQIEGYALRGRNNIYFMCVEFIDGRFVGYAPVVEAGEEDGDSEAYIGLSTSADGVSWRPWTRVLKSELDVDLVTKKRYRSLDQPVCGLLRRDDGRTMMYVQREVAGIYSPSQDCCNKPRTRLEAVDVTRTLFPSRPSAERSSRSLLAVESLAAASFTQRWAPAVEYANLHEGNATDWLHKVDAELTRSLAYFDRPASPEDLVTDLFAKQEAVFVVDGRVFMHKSYFKRVKVGGHGVLLKESYARSKFGNCAWLHVDAASGGDEPLDKRYPTTVIAKQRGYGQPGILVPNPYWGGHQPDGLLRRWAAHAAKLAAKAKKLPLSQRTAKVMWRGDCRVHGGKACAFQEGNRARLLGSSLTSTRPDLFDVRCKVNDVAYRPPKDFSCVAPSSRPALQQARRDALRHPPLTKDFVHNEDFVKWRYLLNLPGQTSGSRLLCGNQPVRRVLIVSTQVTPEISMGSGRRGRSCCSGTRASWSGTIQHYLRE